MQNNSFSSLVRRYKSATAVGVASSPVVPLAAPLNPLNPLGTPSNTAASSATAAAVVQSDQVSPILQNSYLVSPHCASQPPSGAQSSANHLAPNSLNVFPSSNSSASVAAAAAYRAYRTTPYCYFYPGKLPKIYMYFSSDFFCRSS